METKVLKRTLRFFDGLGIVVGIIIGSGIFSSPGITLERSGSPGSAILSWLVSGCLVALTSQCYLELGTMIPSAGGDFDYLKSSFGDRIAFSFAWFNFFISKPGSQAILSTISGYYLESGLSLLICPHQHCITSESSSWLTKLFAISILLSITAINCLGIKESSIFQNILTSAKLLLVLFVLISALFLSIIRPTMTHAVENLSPSHSFEGTNSILGFASSMLACLWGYDGWADLNFMQEELMEPERQLPRIALWGLFVVTCTFVLANLAYFTLLSRDTVLHSSTIAVSCGEVLDRALGGPSRPFSVLLALCVSISTAGSLHGSVMAGGRALFAVARDGKFPSIFSRLNTNQAPYLALCLQGFWGVVLLLVPGSGFRSLLDFVGPISWLYYALTSSAVMLLRRREPCRHRPYRVWAYPLPPLLVLSLASFIIFSSFHRNFMMTAIPFVFVSLSIPVHWFLLEVPSPNSSFSPLSRPEFLLSPLPLSLPSEDNSDSDIFESSAHPLRGAI